MGIFILLTFIIRSLALELSFGTLIITGILILNLLSFWEISGRNINTPYWIISFICFFCFVNCYLAFVRLPFKNYYDIVESERALFKKIILTLYLPILVMGLAFAMFSALIVYSIQMWEPNFAKAYPLLRVSYVAVVWLVISLLVAFIYLSKVKDMDIKKFLINGKYNVMNYDRKKITKFFILMFVFIILFGSVVEIQRGMWVMWIETVLIVGLMSLIVWKIYKHAFYAEEGKVKKE